MGGSQISGPTTWVWAGQTRGYSSWGKVPTSASCRLMPPWTWSERRQAEALAHGVEVLPAPLQAVLHGARGASPEGAAERGARQAGADRVDRGASGGWGCTWGISVAPGTLLKLGGERGGEREDVGDHHLRFELAHERERVAGGVHDGLVEVQRRPAAIREDVVLGGGGEAHTLRLHVARASAPRLQRHLVPARRQRAPERDHREGVARIPEGAEQHPPRTGPVGTTAIGRAT